MFRCSGRNRRSVLAQRLSHPCRSQPAQARRVRARTTSGPVFPPLPHVFESRRARGEHESRDICTQVWRVFTNRVLLACCSANTSCDSTSSPSSCKSRWTRDPAHPSSTSTPNWASCTQSCRTWCVAVTSVSAASRACRSV